MAKVSIIIEVSEKLAAALPELSPQVEQCLSSYGAKVLSISTESNLSTECKVNNQPQEELQVETLHLGFGDNKALEELAAMVGNFPTEEDLYAEYDSPNVSTPTPVPVIKPRVNVEAPVEVQQASVAPSPFPTTQVDYDLLAKLERFTTYCESNRNDKSNQVLQVHSRVEKDCKLIGVTMKAPLDSKQVDSFLNYVGPKVGINVHTMQPFYGYKLVTDPISTDISQLADNRYFIIKVPTTSNQVSIPQVQYAHSY